MKRTMLFIAGVVVVACIFLGLSCANSADKAKNTSRAAAAPSNTPSGNTAFDFELFKQVAKFDKGKNVFISPTSVYLALAMTYNGAKGTTRDAMAKALKIENISTEAFNKAKSALIADLRSPDPEVKLDIANSIWTNDSIPIDSDFITKNEAAYYAEISDLDFDNPNSPAIINAWVKKNTQDKIEKLVDQLDPQLVMVLVNAVYFKGTWTAQFDPDFNRKLPFHLAGGEDKQVTMMTKSARYKYYKGQGFSGVSLPYGDGRISMYILLPDQGTNLSDFIDGLNPETWEKWMTGFAPQQVMVVLPKFKLEYSIEMNDPLKAMGMGIAFEKSADFTGMSPARMPIWIGQVLHKTYVDVNETGTEAAAVTGVFMAGSAMPPEPIEFTVDRPFVLAIRDNKTKEILFMGSVVDPS